ncbi:limonene-1,2-epoxide hydrolase family protein [Croceicoccus bisphenolivorans]|uniref:limonene-1,2-epoxide hydrolase family protein n=1 Tax=Croceicoccus bisphenolivorans TaxID=1783232 RepID=UPI00082A40C1|nr:limonene-1,2-epoxide hydrolase family protein [Croceicoccus bisphenolivorans]
MTEPEAESIVRAFISAWNAKDRDAIGRAFHPDIRCTGANYPTAEGREAAITLCDPFLVADAIDWQILNCAVRGTTVFTERVDRFFYTGKPELVVEACGVFDLDESGLIRRWHDYFDTTDIRDTFGED